MVDAFSTDPDHVGWQPGDFMEARETHHYSPKHIQSETMIVPKKWELTP